ncbi:MFS transporter [Deinococcus sp. Arct2-2]|uniref:MFS transporter n=1 Tax=Deinococcus sp. Arct2-2 TaxID=2568653 RepID=UPI0010A42F94|nr:MFS transporter [Deinococcus sp. Arct2-2]THF71459.1 MFS transporter [Deinococcus sp. Arct2-2]
MALVRAARPSPPPSRKESGLSEPAVPPTTVPPTTVLPTAVPPTLSAGLLLVVLIVAFEAMAVSTVLPRVADDLQGLALYGWASSAFLLSSLFGAVFTGLLSDRRGLAVGASVSLAVFALGLLGAGLAPTMPVFVLGRLVQGLGAGGLGLLPFAVITSRYPEQARARMLAAVSSAWLIPALTGPLIASLIADAWSWRAVFWGLLPVLVLGAPLCILPLRNAPKPSEQSASGPGGLVSRRVLWPALGLSVASGSLIEGLRRPDLWGLALVAAGAVGIALTSRSLFPAGLWRAQRGLPAALAVRGLAAFALLGTNSFLPLALHELRGLTLTQAGGLLSVGGATWTLGAWLQAQLERRFGPHTRPARVRAGMLGVLAGLLLTTAGVLGGLPLWSAYVGWFVACLSMGIGYNSNSLFALASADSQGAGAGELSGQLANIEVLMVALAAGAGGALIARATPLSTAFALAFGVTLAGAVLARVVAVRLQAKG